MTLLRLCLWELSEAVCSAMVEDMRGAREEGRKGGKEERRKKWVGEAR